MTTPSRPATPPQPTFVSSLTAMFIEAWFVMLLIGAAHSVAHSVPAVGYWPAVLAIMALNWTTSRFRRLFK